MDSFLGPIGNFWKRLTLGQKGGLIATIAIAVSLLALLVTWTSKAPFVTLYSDLNGKDASRIADDLRDSKIPYRLADGGSKIMVPQPKVYDLRLHFASLGLPSSGGLGYELFDKPMLGMTEFMQKMNYHRALEGELSRTIGELEEVESARVHLVLPAPSLFTEDKKEPTASVVLRLNPNAELLPRQIQGIRYLMAYAVEGLSIGNITIVDASGNPLSGTMHQDAIAGLTATQLEVQFAVEEALAKKAKAMLDEIVGPGKSQVRIAAKLNWDRVERTVERFDVDQIAVRSEERRESSGEGGTENGSNNEESQITNYEVPRTVEKMTPEVGDIKRLSVSVLVDGTYRKKKDAEGKEVREFVDRTPAELKKFTDLVKTSVGFDDKRNDQISVASFPFENVEETLPAVDTESKHQFLLKLMEKGILAFLLVGIFLIARSFLKRVSQALPRLPAMEVAPVALPSGRKITTLPAGTGAGTGPETALQSGSTMSLDGPKVVFKEKMSGPIEIEEEEIPVEALKRAELQKRAAQFMTKKPEQAAQLVRSWMMEESGEFKK